MESKLKTVAQDSVGEIPTYENLLLREDNYPHLVDRTQWQPAGTKPDHPCLCETRFHELDTDFTFQKWNGNYFCTDRYRKDDASIETDKSFNQHVQWREVQS